MTPEFISAKIDARLDWLSAVDALEKGHEADKAQLTDSFLYRGSDTLLNRAAWIEGLGAIVKTATVFPDNPEAGLPAVNGAVALYSDHDGQLEAFVDFHLVTRWKTAADSLLAARCLARRDSRKITLVGAGAVARNMHDAYRALFPEAEFTVWARRHETAERFAQGLSQTQAEADLEKAVSQADIICTATMSRTPLVMGEWLRPGQHLDLIGAFRPDMREVDDLALHRASVFVDSFETVLAHIGELKIPLEQGVIHREHVIADFYGIRTGAFARADEQSITICKNGGGAHLDLMISRYILSEWCRHKKLCS
ncbi:MAG: ornithine cyclodeaminase [Rhodobacteraceae bacterium]|nr:MAG: ornithine cyclodeaminase [Paracoccaceae bacterium]